MLPVPRTTLASVLNSQTAIAPAEHDVGVRERRGQRSAGPAHGPVERGAAEDERAR